MTTNPSGFHNRATLQDLVWGHLRGCRQALRISILWFGLDGFKPLPCARCLSILYQILTALYKLINDASLQFLWKNDKYVIEMCLLKQKVTFIFRQREHLLFYVENLTRLIHMSLLNATEFL